jgi:hypothetical protein
MRSSTASSGRSPSAVARSVTKRAGQVPTIAAIAGSWSQSTSRLVSRPVTRSRAATISRGVVVIDGRFIAVRLPQAVSSTAAARRMPSRVRGGEDSATGVSGGTGHVAR